MKESKNNQETANKEARITVSVTKNVIKGLKHGQSSVDFIADNNLFHLDAAGKNQNVATKNNSRAAFFLIRDIVYEVLGDRQKAWFAVGGGGDIKDIAVTLDKVTVERVSYTCLLTYYFYGGVIYCMLNKLMKTEEEMIIIQRGQQGLLWMLCARH